MKKIQDEGKRRGTSRQCHQSSHGLFRAGAAVPLPPRNWSLLSIGPLFSRALELKRPSFSFSTQKAQNLSKRKSSVHNYRIHFIQKHIEGREQFSFFVKSCTCTRSSYRLFRVLLPRRWQTSRSWQDRFFPRSLLQ